MIRVFKKKEDSIRYKEKLGFYKIKPELKGDVFWVNLASVGELNSSIKLIKLLAMEANVIVTSVTLTSAIEFKKKDFSNCKFQVLHQFAPLDSIICVNRFLQYFKPKKAIFLESEIWVNMILESSKLCKIYLVNSKISPISFKRWLKIKPFFVWFFGHFDKIFTSTIELANDFKKLGLNAEFLGNLKYDANYKLPNNLPFIKQNTVVIFASMHLQEMPILIPEMKKLIFHDITILLMPRHIDRALEIGYMLRQNDMESSFRTKHEAPEKGKIYIIDTMGEAIDFYNFSDIIFIGGGLVDGIGGHNIIEGCVVKKPIITGSFYFNCKEVVEEFQRNNAVIVSNTPAKEILHLMQNPHEGEIISENATKMLNKYHGIANNIISKIL